MKRLLTVSLLGVAVLLASLTVFGSAAAGPNLLQNGDFAQGTTGWAEPASQNGVLVQPFFGALTLTETTDTPSNESFWVSQCVAGISDMHEYTIAGDMLLPSGQGRSGLMSIQVNGYYTTDCSGSNTGPAYSGSSSPSAWTHWEDTFGLDNGTKSIRVSLIGFMAPTSGGQLPQSDLTVAFDNISLTQGNQVKGTTIEICKGILDNGDPYLDEDTFTFTVAAQNNQQQPFVTDFPVTVLHEGWAGCNTLDLDSYGMAGVNSFTVTENPKPGWTNQAGYPISSANNGPAQVGTSVVVPNVAPMNAEFINKRVANEGTVLPPEPKTVIVCTQIENNGDADTESMKRFYHLQVKGEQSFVGFYLAPVEGQPPVCESIDLNAVGKANATDYEVLQAPDPAFTDAAGYPKYHIGNGFVSGSVADFKYPTGSSPTFTVGFTNKEAVAAPPPPPPSTPSKLELCKTVLDDGDGIVEGGDFWFDFGLVGQQQQPQHLVITALEGQTSCGIYDPVSAGYPANGSYYLTEDGAPAGWDDASGYPKHSTGGALASGATALFTLDPQTLEAHIEFVNRDSHDGPDAPPPSPDPKPTETPDPPSMPPPPTSTPTPPTPPVVSTPTPKPPQGSDNPPPPSSTPAPQSDPGQPASDAGDQPLVGPDTTDDVAGASSTPIAPSAGTGQVTHGSGSFPLALLIGLLMLVSSAPLVLLVRRR